jgi:ATP-binding cassette, subfamily B, bacterial
VLTKDLRERGADVGSLFVETLIGIRSVISSNAGEYEARRFGKQNSRFVDALLRLQLVSFLSGGLPGTILAVSTALVFLYGGKLNRVVRGMESRRCASNVFGGTAYQARS